MSNTKYCMECGKVINRRAVFCPFCGCQVGEINTGKDRDIIINNNNNATIQSKPKKKHSCLLDLIGLIFLFPFYLIYMLVRD